MALRVTHALLANGLFLLLSAIFWSVATVMSEATARSAPNVAAGSIMMLLFGCVFMAVMTCIPATLSSAIYIVGGGINRHAALTLAVVIGASTLFAALTGDTARKWAMHISVFQAVLLAILYAVLWVATVALMQRSTPLGEVS